MFNLSLCNELLANEGMILDEQCRFAATGQFEQQTVTNLTRQWLPIEMEPFETVINASVAVMIGYTGLKAHFVGT